MALFNTYAELALKNAPTQKVIVNTILNESPIFASIPTQVSSTATQNVYQNVKSITAGGMRPLDAPSNQTKVDMSLARTDLSVIDGEIEIGRDTADIVGKDELFGTQAPLIISATMANVERSIFEDNLRQFAIDNGNYELAGGTANTNSSMVCIRWGAGVNIGLTSPSVINDGKSFKFKDLNGGNFYKSTQSNGDNINVYGREFRTLFGLQLANAKQVSLIGNIDTVNDKIPTIKQINNMILNAQAGGNNSVIYCNPRVLRAIGYTHKLERLNLFSGDTNLTTEVFHLEGVPVVTSYTLQDGTEANLS